MSNDLYNAPESDLTGGKRTLYEPHPLVVAFSLVGISFVVSLIAIGIELVFGVTVPGDAFLSTLLPAYLGGYIFGRKRGAEFSRDFRIKVIAIWFGLSLILTVAFAALFAWDTMMTLLQGSASLLVIAVIVFMLALSGLLSYFMLRMGERTGVKTYKP